MRRLDAEAERSCEGWNQLWCRHPKTDEEQETHPSRQKETGKWSGTAADLDGYMHGSFTTRTPLLPPACLTWGYLWRPSSRLAECFARVPRVPSCAGKRTLALPTQLFQHLVHFASWSEKVFKQFLAEQGISLGVSTWFIITLLKKKGFFPKYFC